MFPINRQTDPYHMKKLIIAGILLLIISDLFAQIPPTPSAAYAHELQARFPLKPSSLRPNCVEWDNPYFNAIIDTSLRESVVTYAYIHRRVKIRS